MDGFKIFTLNPEGFPLDKTRELVDYLHDHDQHYVMMVDPGKKSLSDPHSQANSSKSGCVSSIHTSIIFKTHAEPFLGLPSIQQRKGRGNLYEGSQWLNLQRRGLARNHRISRLVQ
jgi:hypothetical protein